MMDYGFTRRPGARVAHALGVALLGFGTLALFPGCRDDSSQRRTAMEQLPARRLIGVWDATLWLERPVSLTSKVHSPPDSIVGSIALLEDQQGQFSPEEMPDPTHVGVYDLDVGPFGFRLRDPGDVPVAVALTAARAPSRQPGAAGVAVTDSVTIVLSPGSARYPCRLVGTFRGDGIVGVWTAGQALGGGGSFVLRRHRAPP